MTEMGLLLVVILGEGVGFAANSLSVVWVSLSLFSGGISACVHSVPFCFFSLRQS